MRLKIAALIILLGPLLVGCAQQDQYNGYRQSMGTSTPSETPLSEEATVAIDSFSYNPPSITVKKGTEVTWENKQSVTHTVTSEEDLFDSGDIVQGESYSYTFEEPGTYKYYCTIHPSMKGEIVVVE